MFVPKSHTSAGEAGTMNKKILIAGGVFILVLIIAVALVIQNPGEKSGGKRQFFEVFSDMGGGGAESSVLMQDQSVSYGEFIDRLKNGEINFVWELWAMRAKCPEDQTPAACDASILAFISKRYSSPEKEKLVDLFKKYFQYESEMREAGPPSSSDFQQKYEYFKKKRREVLGKNDAELIFGMEEAQVDFLSLSHRMITASKGLSGDERVKQYETLKKTTYGPYYDSIVKREDKFNNYQIELSLRDDDMKKLSDAERKARTSAMQERYFGKDAAAQIAKAEAEEAAEQKRLSDYEAKEKEFLAANANLSDADKAARLKEIRVKMLGQEESDAYERRRQFDEDVKKIK